MNAIVLWVFVPIGVALFLFSFQDRKRIITFIGGGLALVLAAFAWVFPVGKIIRLGSWNFEVTGQFFVYGRQILITPEDMPILIMLYLILAVWFLGSLVANTPSYFVSIGMIILALLVTAMSIEPFFYAAILFEFVVLLFVVLLSAPERSPTKGVIRFLIFQTLGMLFILFAGWLFSLIDIDLVDGKLFSRSMILMAIGFAFLLGIFPFLTWIPMLAGQNNVYLTSFMFNLFLNGVFLFGLDFLTQFVWIYDYVNVLGTLQVIGGLMVGVGGIGALFQNNVGRILGFTMITEVGKSLLAFGLGQQGYGIYFSLFLGQVFSLAVWSLALNLLRTRKGTLEFQALKGVALDFPYISAGMLVGQYSLAGLPLLTSFPIVWVLGSELATQAFSWVAMWLLAGSVSLIFSGMRVLSVSVTEIKEEEKKETFDLFSRLMLILGSSVLVILSFFPNYLLHLGTLLAGSYR